MQTLALNKRQVRCNALDACASVGGDRHRSLWRSAACRTAQMDHHLLTPDTLAKIRRKAVLYPTDAQLQQQDSEVGSVAAAAAAARAMLTVLFFMLHPTRLRAQRELWEGYKQELMLDVRKQRWPVHAVQVKPLAHGGRTVVVDKPDLQDIAPNWH